MEVFINWIDSNINSQKLKKDLKNFLDDINSERRKDYQFMNLKKIFIESNKLETNYQGLPELILDKKIILFHGRTFTGKTSTYDKFFHFLSNYHQKDSPLKGWRSKIIVEMYLKSFSNNDENILSLTFDTNDNKEHKGNLKSPTMVLPKQIKNIQSFLIGNIVNTPLQTTKFVGEKPYLLNIVKNEENIERIVLSEQLKSLEDYLNNILEITKEDVVKKFNSIYEKKKEQENLKNSINNKSAELNRIVKVLNSKNEIKTVNEKYDVERKQTDKIIELRKKIRISYRDKQKFISELRIIDSKLTLMEKVISEKTKFEEYFFNSRPMLCLICDNPLPKDFVFSRVRRNECYGCGINLITDYYDLEKEKLDFTSDKEQLINLKKEKDEYSKKIEIINSYLKEFKKELKISSNLSNESLHISLSFNNEDLKEEFRWREEKKDKIEQLLEILQKDQKRIENEIEKLKDEHSESAGIKDDINKFLEFLKISISDKVANHVKFIKERINYYFLRYIDENIGRIDIVDKKMVLRQIQNIDGKDIELPPKNITGDSTFSEDGKRFFKLSVSLAFQDYILEFNKDDEPKILFIDNLEKYEEIINSIIHDLKILSQKGYQIFLFSKNKNQEKFKDIESQIIYKKFVLNKKLRQSTLLGFTIENGD